MSFAQTVLDTYWSNVAKQCGVDTSDAWRDYLQYVINQYTDPSRHYHNLDHPVEMLREFEHLRSHIARPETFVLKVIGHDLIYDPRSAQNELNSAAALCAKMAAVGFDKELVDDVHRGILATQTHASTDPDDQYLITLDLARLAETPDAFRAYSEALEREYVPHFGEAAYREGRLKWAKGFLERNPIFPTEYGRKRYEALTRRNLSQLVSNLKEIP